MTDSGSFDNVLEFLVRAGKRSLPEAAITMVPEAYENDLVKFFSFCISNISIRLFEIFILQILHVISDFTALLIAYYTLSCSIILLM